MDHGARGAVHLAVYGDFNCPFSALATARATVLEARGLAVIEGRAVEHDPAIPVTVAFPNPIVPTMVLPDGYVSRGLGALDRLPRINDRRA
jgi:hypothetical protein